jgi:enterobacterial common antigen flippase
MRVAAAESPVQAESKRHTYAVILKSTALIGGSTVANVAFGIVRNKAMALILGPAGFGLMGIYSSIAEVAQSLAGMGIQSSGVRQIAAAVGSGDVERVARTAGVLRRVAIALGVLGALLLLVFAGRVSELTFGHGRQSASIALLSLAVLLREVAAGQSALVQGMRRISDLARLTVLSALFGTLLTIPAVYAWGTAGVVPSLVGVAGVTALTSSWYSRRVQLPRVAISFAQLSRETAALLKLGTAFMVTAFLTMAAGYAIRTLVLRSLGFDAAGQYQAAWVLGGLYVTFILQAMGADFYPRLTALADDNDACNRAVNQQAQISLLLAGPGVLATLTLAPMVIALFYSPQFHPAVTILRWICVGMTLRVISWPMGYIVVAKGAQRIMVATEVAAAIVHVGLAWLLLPAFGLAGAGVAFFGLYVWHGMLIYVVVRRVSGFRWSAVNLKLGMIFLPLSGVTFAGFYLMPMWPAVALGLSLSVVTGVYSARAILLLLPPESTPRVLRPWLPRLGLAGAHSR